MPLYEYRCTDCGKTKEKLQKISDPKLPHLCGEKIGEHDICAGVMEYTPSRIGGFTIEPSKIYI